MDDVTSNPLFSDSDIERFWSFVPERPADSCWEWQGMKGGSSNAYGKFYFRGRQHYAHRVSFAMHRGSIPAGKFVCHHCDNPSCVRPDHLFPGSPKDNIQDAVKKGRLIGKKSRTEGYRGERNAMAKLTEEDVLEIRRRYASGTSTQKELAKEYGVTPPHISGICMFKFWPWLGGDRPVNMDRADYLTVQEAGDMMGCSLITAYRMVERGTLHAEREKGNFGVRLIRRQEVEAFLRSLRTAHLLLLLRMIPESRREDENRCQG